MGNKFLDGVYFLATSAGTVDFIPASAIQGYRTPANGGAANTITYGYRAESASLNEWEIGVGTYSTTGPTLARTTVIANHLGTTAKVNFTAAPNVGVVALSQDIMFPAGTLMLFQQTSAPTGWTKETTHNDKALRVVSGTASSGGTNAFSTVMAQTTVGSTTLSISQIPAIDPTIAGASTNAGSYSSAGGGTFVSRTLRGTNLNGDTFSAGSTSFGWTTPGGGGSHNHSITMDMKYVDVIIATKD